VLQWQWQERGLVVDNVTSVGSCDVELLDGEGGFFCRC